MPSRAWKPKTSKSGCRTWSGRRSCRSPREGSHAATMSQPYTMMSTIARRIQRLEALEFQHRAKDGHRSITLEELCRLSWRRDKKGFLESAKNNSYQLFVSQF